MEHAVRPLAVLAAAALLSALTAHPVLASADPVVGVIDGDIDRAKDARGAHDLGTESVLGNFVADRFVGATRTDGDRVDIALVDPATLGADLLLEASDGESRDGLVRSSEVAAVQPSPDTLVTMTLTGAQLADALEQQWQVEGSDEPTVLLGVSYYLAYTYDPTAAQGSRIGRMGDLEAIAPDHTVRVVTTSSLAQGGSGFTALADATDRRDTGLTGLDALLAFFDEQNYAVVTASRTERATYVGQDARGRTPARIETEEFMLPGEVAPMRVVVRAGEALDGTYRVDFRTDGTFVVESPVGCEVTRSPWVWSEVSCLVDGFAAGETSLDFLVRAQSSFGTHDFRAFVSCVEFDGCRLPGGAVADGVIDISFGELNGRQSDLDHDGTADVVVVDGRGRLVMYRGSSPGRFVSSSLIGTGFVGQVVLPGDVTGPNSGVALDDVVLQTRSGSIYVYKNQGNPQGSPALGRGRLVLTGFGGWTTVGPGDWDGDGLADLVSRAPTGRLYLLPGRGDGTFGAPRAIGTGWSGFTALLTPGDLDGDGHVDLVGRDGANRLFLYPGSGTGGFLRPRLIATGWSFPSSASVGDFDHDLEADLMGRTSAGDLYLYPGDGTGRLGKAVLIGRGWQSFQLLG